MVLRRANVNLRARICGSLGTLERALGKIKGIARIKGGLEPKKARPRRRNGIDCSGAPANHSCVKEGTQDLRRNSPPTQGGIFLLWRLSPFLPCDCARR